MAITFIAGEEFDSETAAPVYTTSSVSIVADDLIICWVFSEGGTTPNQPSVGGTNGFDATYTLIAGDDDCGAVLQMFAFTAVAASSTPGTISFTFSDNRADNITFGYCFARGVDNSSPIVTNQAGLGDRCAGSGTFSATDKWNEFDATVRQGNTLSAITAGNAVVLIGCTANNTTTIAIDTSWTNGVELQVGPASPVTAQSFVGHEVGGTPTNDPVLDATNSLTRQMGVAFELAVGATDNAGTSLDTIRTYQIGELVKP